MFDIFSLRILEQKEFKNWPPVETGGLNDCLPYEKKLLL